MPAVFNEFLLFYYLHVFFAIPCFNPSDLYISICPTDVQIFPCVMVSLHGIAQRSFFDTSNNSINNKIQSEAVILFFLLMNVCISIFVRCFLSWIYFRTDNGRKRMRKREGEKRETPKCRNDPFCISCVVAFIPCRRAPKMHAGEKIKFKIFTLNWISLSVDCVFVYTEFTLFL